MLNTVLDLDAAAYCAYCNAHELGKVLLLCMYVVRRLQRIIAQPSGGEYMRSGGARVLGER